MSTFYDILGIEETATGLEVKQAYYRLAQTCHPDVNMSKGAHELMAQINIAYETLMDPIRRAEYDSVIGASLRDGSDECRSSCFDGVELEIIQREKLLGHRTPIYCCSFLNSSSFFMTSSFDNEIYLWELGHASPLSQIKIEGGGISSVEFISKELSIAVGSSETNIVAWCIRGNQVESYRSHLSEWVCTAKASPCGRWVVGGSISGRLLWMDMLNRKKPIDCGHHKQSLTALGWSCDGSLLASGSSESIVHIWDVSTHSLLGSLTALRSGVTAVAFSDCKQYIAVAGIDLSIRIFRNGHDLPVKVFFGHEKPIEALSFHPGGSLLASGSRDGILYLWSTFELGDHFKLRASYQPLSSVVFSSDGKNLITAGLDKVIRVWELRLGLSGFII